MEKKEAAEQQDTTGKAPDCLLYLWVHSSLYGPILKCGAIQPPQVSKKALISASSCQWAREGVSQQQISKRETWYLGPRT